MYSIKIAAGTREVIKDLVGGTIQIILEELNEQEESREEGDSKHYDSRNRYKSKMSAVEPG